MRTTPLLRTSARMPDEALHFKSGIAFPLLLLSLLCLTSAALAAPESRSPASDRSTQESRYPTTPPLSRASIKVPFGGLTSEKTAVIIAETTVRLRALADVSTSLDTDLAARMSATDREQLQALASAVYPVTIAITTLSASPDAPPDMVVATARIWASPRNLETDIRNALRHTDNLELRFLTLRGMDILAAEGLDLLQRSHRNRQIGTTNADAPFASRLEHIAGQLEARRMYLDALRDFDTTWRGAQKVAPLLEEALTSDPENPLLYLGRGEALLLLDRPYEALEALHAATRLPHPPARAFYMRGIAYLRLHLPSYADDDFTRALERRPEKALWWSARGAARLVAGDTEPMCGDFYQACALGDCDGLVDVRKRGLCLEPPQANLPRAKPPDTAPPVLETPPDEPLPSPEVPASEPSLLPSDSQ